MRKEIESLLRQMYWTDKVVDGKPVAQEKKLLYLLMNKPAGFYTRYYRDFGQLLVDMEKRGIHVGVGRRRER